MSDWIPHRRGDGELIGWMHPDGDGFVVIDLLGRRCTEAVDWLEAEEALEELGIGYLADPYEMRLDGEAAPESSGLLDSGGAAAGWLRVRITEVSTEAVRVKRDDWGDITVPLREYVLPFPPRDRLRPLA